MPEGSTSDPRPPDAGPVAGGATPNPTIAWHAREGLDVVTELRSSAERGLTAAEIPERLRHHGPNRLPEPPPPSLIRLIFEQISDVTVLTLIGAAIISLVIALVQDEGSAIEKYGDTGAILGIVILNAVLGILQQKKADRALAALKELTATHATVVRDGTELEVPAADVVPGDVLVLEAGDKITADARLLAVANLEVSEAALTGESRPCVKNADVVLAPDTHLADRQNLIYAGTVVQNGKAQAVVVATGVHTEVGKIATMVSEAQQPPTPLERDLHRFGIIVVIGCLVCSAAIFLIGALQGNQPYRELFMVAVSLAVAAIPEGLPAITTIVLAMGTHTMARHGALVRRLHAVETLGCTQVLCSDKTGTLTRNQMKVVRLAGGSAVWHLDQPEPPPPIIKDVARVAGGARGKDPTDVALADVGVMFGLSIANAPLVAEVPFSSERRLSSTVFEDGKAVTVTTRGAYERVLESCTHVLGDDGEERPLTAEDQARIADLAERWADDAIRVIALARRRAGSAAEENWEHSLTFVGLAGIADPLRPEVVPAVSRAHGAGIHVVMITGDHPTTARAIARESGILRPEHEVVTGAEVSGMAEPELAERLPRIAVVARATAADKMRIVNGLKLRGEIAGMTGDGVNDAPALKSADIGVSMGKEGTDVAREASDMVLADDNFATIVAAVAEGRAIYANIRRFITFLFAANAGLVLAVTIASILGWDQPMAPIQILWINLITNGLPALALGLEPSVEDRMNQPPRSPKEPIVRLTDVARIVIVGAIMAAGGLWVYWLGTDGIPTKGNDAGRTAAFTVFAIAPLVYAFAKRSDHLHFWQSGLLTNRMLLGAVAVGVGLQAVAVLVPGASALFKTGPMDGDLWVKVVVAAILPFVAVELMKLAGMGRRTIVELPSEPSKNLD